MINWPSTRQTIHGVIWVGGLAGLVAGWVLGVPRLQAHVAAQRRAATPEVRFIDQPAWMSGDIEAWLVLTVQRQITADPLDREALARARSALLQTGCFESVQQVRRHALDRIEVEAVFLQPFAAVIDRDGEHLVDPRGRLLPDGYQMGPGGHFIRITGVAFDRPARPGEQWIGADLTAALHVIRMIVTRSWWRQVIAVDVSDVERMRLTSQRNCRIIWGAPPGEEAIGEVTAEQKLSRLDYLDEQFGRIDVDCPNELDITDPEVVTAR